jgi:serine/threonine protein kinase
MSLEPGARFGSFEIVAPLGAGGMGEVWRARDPRLGRDVALKLVGEAFLSDAERMARFDREAKLLAGFHHPHIAVLYGQEDCGGRRALVMELVEGETLAERLAAGPIPPREALSLARQVAEALEHAHAQGIVHRDLKPANVKVTPDREVKVLDFGLGKPLAAEAATDPLSSPTLSRPATGAGVILGTAAYMSPEQARGQAVDRRSDVWAFGVILFEMLTGTRLFRGGTTSDVLAAVLTREVEWDRLPAATPAAARRLLRRCLERDPRERLHDFADVRIEIAEALREMERPVSAAARPLRPWRAALPWGIAALAIASAVAAILARRPPPAPSRVSHLRLSLQPRPLVMAGFALSPDGRLLAYVANGLIHVRDLDRDDVRVLPEARGSRPFFSPDGAWIGFVGPDEVPRKVAASGGPGVALADPPSRVGRCAWAPDDTILCTQPSSPRPGVLVRTSAHGGAPQPVPTSPEGATERVGWPHTCCPEGAPRS